MGAELARNDARKAPAGARTARQENVLTGPIGRHEGVRDFPHSQCLSAQSPQTRNFRIHHGVPLGPFRKTDIGAVQPFSMVRFFYDVGVILNRLRGVDDVDM
jgi:hypothetical protein